MRFDCLFTVPGVVCCPISGTIYQYAFLIRITVEATLQRMQLERSPLVAKCSNPRRALKTGQNEQWIN
jgi:hypothetical protein